MGIGGFRLFNWLDRRNEPGPSGQVVAEAMSTRAVIAGRRTYELAGRRQGDHHHGVPVFVLELELVRLLSTSDSEDLAKRVTHLRYRVRRP
jgi:hypothetical protein